MALRLMAKVEDDRHEFAAEATTGVRPKIAVEHVSASSAHPMVLLGGFVVALGAVAVPITAVRVVGVGALALLGIAHELGTCRRIDVTHDGVRVVVDEESEQLVPWEELVGVSRRSLGPLQTIVLHTRGRDVRVRLVTRERARVDAVAAAIRRALA